MISESLVHHLAGEERAGCFTLIGFLMHVSVMCLFLDGDMGWCVRSKAVVLFLLIHCFMCLTLFVGGSCVGICFVMHFVSFRVLQIS